MTVSWKHSGNSGVETNLSEIPARRGFSLSYNGKTLLSRIDPVTQAERLAAELKLGEATLYLCPSPLYGYGLPLLLERLSETGHNSAILCLEFDEGLFKLSEKAMAENREKFSPFANDKNLALIRVFSPEDACFFVRKTWGGRRFRRVESIHFGGGWQLFPQLYGQAEALLGREISLEWGNAMTLIRLGRLYTKNFIQNLSCFCKSGNAALDFGALPTLVLGAGPSLDPVLDGLSSLWGGRIPQPPDRNFRIVCVDSCLAALNERGIRPDLVVILESQHWNLRAFIGLGWGEINAALDLSSLPASARLQWSNTYFYTTAWTELRLFARLEKEGLLPRRIAPLGSVGLSAVALALGCSLGPVLTAGIDFSYTLDACHARSTPGHRDLETRQNRLKGFSASATAFRDGTFSAVSKTGKKVRCDPAMRNYRELFEKEFGAESRLYDIEGPGLPLGVKPVSPNEAFAILNGSSEVSGGLRTQAEKRRLTPDEKQRSQKMIRFIRREMDYLKAIKEILSGISSLGQARLGELLETADYLWAHFPECAGAGLSGPPVDDLSFLKRVRIEIEPFLKNWEMTLEELERVP